MNSTTDTSPLLDRERKTDRVIWKGILKFTIPVFVVVFLVLGTTVGQMLQIDYDFNRPYFITYFSTSWLILLLPIQYLASGLVRLKNQQKWPSGSSFVKEVQAGIQMSFLKFTLFIFPFTVMWFAANYLYAIGLPLTNLPSVLSLEQTTTVLVFILSILVLKEKPTILKVLSVVVCVGGVVVIAFSDNNTFHGGIGKRALMGDVFIILSTIASATFMVFQKKFLFELSRVAVNIFLSMIGLCNAIFFSIGLVIVHFTGFEVVSFPSSSMGLTLLFVNALIALFFNVLLNWGIILTSPIFIRIAAVCSIPASFLIQWLISSEGMNWMRILGAVLIFVGFLLLVFEEHRLSQKKKLDEIVK